MKVGKGKDGGKSLIDMVFDSLVTFRQLTL